MSMFETAYETFNQLSSRKKRFVVTGSIVTGLAILLYVLIQIGNNREEAQPETSGKLSSITLNSRLLEDSLAEGVRAEQRSQAGVITELGTAFKEVKEDIASVREALKAMSERKVSDVTVADLVPQNELAPKNELADMQARPKFPPPVVQGRNKGASTGNPNEQPIRQAGLEPAVRQIKGGIAGMAPTQAAPAQKKSVKAIYLPVGFMDAVLLTGVDSMVGGEAQSNPEPVLARVQAPAVLPNHVRANLQGCFVVGNAMGVLAKERVEVRAVSLSCIDHEERTVIDEPIKGYFVDTDGKKGLSGNVVTRDGAVVGRAFAAGVLEGFGGVAETGAGTRTVSPLGTTQVFDTKQAAIAGLGGGLGGAASSLKDYYLDLAKTITPVIEVGTGKRFVLVIQEGVNLKIRDVNDVDHS